MTAFFYAAMTRFLSYISLLLILAACEQEPQYSKLSGNTMGTKYNITFESEDVAVEALKSTILNELDIINQLMSTYIPDSEINQFNALTTDECFRFSDPTWLVLIAAKDVYHQTDGAFDITVDPLIQRWGFDVAEYDEKVPTDEEVKLLRQAVGTDQLEFNFAEQCIIKANPKLTINLSAIAKGFAVDQLANIMEEFKILNYLVEIGGETKGEGINVHGYPWRIAVEKPSNSATQQELLIIALENTSIATSGDYRNYFEVAGERFSHTIDPTTGYPIDHNLTSVSVIHPSNMYADAYATAMSVMGSEASLEFAIKYQLPVLVIQRQNEELITTQNNLFEEFLIKQ